MSEYKSNTKAIKVGMLVEIREHDVYTGRVVKRQRAKVIGSDGSGWYLKIYGVGTGGGWQTWELYPVN